MSRRPINKEEYNQLFQGDDKHKNALKSALDTRKFEIEMYWKRATYFWAFIAASFAGYFALISSENIDDYRILTILVAFIGFCFSLGWYFVNRGSKYWQENWECHVGALEEAEQGPLFAVHLIIKDKRFRLNGHYQFSVSKTNQNLSVIITAVWCLLFFGSVLYSLHITDCWREWFENHRVVVIAISVVLLCGTYCILQNKSLSRLHKDQPSRHSGMDFSIYDSEYNNRITMGNDEFILYIRKQRPICKIENDELGNMIWKWIRKQDPTARIVDRNMSCKWNVSNKTHPENLPKTAAQIEFSRDILSALYSYLDTL